MLRDGSGVLDDVIKEHVDQVKDEKDPGMDLALTEENIKALLVVSSLYHLSLITFTS